MKVVVDTNVFASGVFWKGPPFQILQAWERGQIKLVVSPPILDEYRRVLIELAEHRPGVKYERSLELVGLYAEVVTGSDTVEAADPLGAELVVQVQVHKRPHKEIHSQQHEGE